MKKVYSKPQILFESFTLSANIAAGCEVKTNTPSQYQCAYGEDDFGQPIFVEGVTACVSKPQGGDYNGICYHNPYDSNNLFNS